MLSKGNWHLLDEKIEKLLKDSGIVGASVALTDREGLIYARGFGLRDVLTGASSTPDSIYRAASLTKMVTGILTLRLAEEGRLSLDAPVRSYLPWLTLSDSGAAEKMTLRHLLSHTSGLPAEYTPEGPWEEGMLAESLKSGLPSLELSSLPGEGKFLYSNWGIRLLSAAIEAVMGERYSTLAERYVLTPVGMSSSAFTRRGFMEDRLSLPHEIGEGGAPVSSNYIKENHTRLATGGLYSTVTDLAALMRVFLRGGVADGGERILTEASLWEMMRRQTVMKSGNGYCLTLMDRPLGTHTLYGHTGNATPYTSAAFADPVSGYAAVAMLNTYSEDLRSELVSLMLSEVI
ncbi:MAG: beta-lactamase family protein [Clostridia bacterium]|nr:beta-lactamase family protein [Clostridia bacterium]